MCSPDMVISGRVRPCLLLELRVTEKEHPGLRTKPPRPDSVLVALTFCLQCDGRLLAIVMVSYSRRTLLQSSSPPGMNISPLHIIVIPDVVSPASGVPQPSTCMVVAHRRMVVSISTPMQHKVQHFASGLNVLPQTPANVNSVGL